MLIYINYIPSFNLVMWKISTIEFPQNTLWENSKTVLISNDKKQQEIPYIIKYKM